MGTEDMRRQEVNVFRMRLLGAEVRGVDSGLCTLKDAINEALRDWVTNVDSTYYLLGSEGADQLALASQRVSSAKAEGSGYEFRQPTLEDALRHVLGAA